MNYFVIPTLGALSWAVLSIVMWPYICVIGRVCRVYVGVPVGVCVRFRVTMRVQI